MNLVVNPRKNSILAHAPPDKMAIIEQAVKAIDVPSGQSDSLLTNPTRMQVYRLHAIDPEPLVKTLEEVGELSPNTRLEVDKRNRVIIAYATLADHVIIRQLVERLDGSGRRFEVVPLRRLAADYVAGTIEFMMGAPPQDQGTGPGIAVFRLFFVSLGSPRRISPDGQVPRGRRRGEQPPAALGQ